ncbi:MAG TPA: hypothetical protein VM165_06425, partial [Planctomycetaceae bacterium]|nr:hypothetical protein [Planctomycetaceae bacterium]
MPELRISENVVIQVPSDVEARRRPLSTGRRGAAGGRMDAVDRALTDADLIIDSEIELSPVPQPPRGGRRTARRGDEPDPSLTVSIGLNEKAVVLIESEGGVFGWVLPRAVETGSRRSGTRQRTLHFPLANAVTPAGGTDRRGRRGIASWIGNRLVDPIRLRVLRYAARSTIDLTVDAVEGNRIFGLVNMAGASDSWRPGGQLPAFQPGRPARILLLVHGTFSTTAGSFAALELTASGRKFLDKARAKYDAVIGFDHRTLAHDPEQNAQDILAALNALPQNSSIDAIGYSRGGLVLRSLIEKLAPASRPDLSFGRTVFVGCTNAGTYLANPENWHALVDLYTNIVMAGARAVSLVSANVAAEVISAGISTLGRFVKLLPDVAITQRRLPGLAAMEPDGKFVGSLNTAAPLEARTEYYVIASDFEPRINPAKGITGELAKYLVDRVADRFFKNRENDLVVDSESMWQFGQQSARLQKDRLNVLPSADSVYHTIYFAADKVGDLLSAWLLRSERRTRAPAGPSDPSARAADEPVTPPARPRPSLPGGILDTIVTRYSVPILESSVGKAGFKNDFLGGPDDFDDASGIELESLDDAGPMPVHRPAPTALPRPPHGTARRGPAPPAVDQPVDRPAGDTGPVIASDTDSRSTACHFAAEMQPTPVLGVPIPL